MKVELVLGSLPQVTKIFQGFLQKKLPFKIMYRLNKISEKLEKEGKAFDKVRREILIKFCELDENGELVVDEQGQVKIKEGQTKELMKHMNAFLAETTEFEIKELRLEDFDEMEEKISGDEMRVLMMFTKDEDEDEEKTEESAE